MLNAVILLKVVPTKSDLILDNVLKMDFVRKAFDTYGRFDIAVFVVANNYKELRYITSKINEIERTEF